MLLALVLSAQALALDCDAVMNMAEVAVPENIIVSTVADSGEWWKGNVIELIACMERAGASPTLVGAIQTWANTGQIEGREPGPAPTRPPDKKAALPPAPPPLPLPEGITAGELRQPAKAVALLLPRAGEGSAEQRALAQVWLGQALLELGMLHSAERSFLESARAQVEGPSNAHAWTGLRQVAERTGDFHALEELVHATPLERWPRGSNAVGFWLTGLRLYEADALSDARKYLAQIPERDIELSLKGKYLEGVIYNTQGKLKSGVKAFRDVYRLPVSEDTQAAALPRIERIKDLSLLNIARIYYGIERFDEAEKYAVLLTSPEDAAWDESRLILAWSRFMQNKLPEASAALDEMSPASWDPEHALLRALIGFAMEEPKEAASRLAPLEAERPTLEAMKSALAAKDQPPGELYARWLASDETSQAPPWLLARLHDDTELRGVLGHIAAIDAEAEITKKKLRRVPEDQLARLREGLPEARAELVSRAEARLRSLLGQEHRRLADLLWQAEIVRLEVIPAEDPRQAEAIRALLTAAPEGEVGAELRFRLAEHPRTPSAEARLLYQQALVDAPDYERAYEIMISLARLDWEAGRRQDAVALLQQAVETGATAFKVPHARVLLGDDAFERRDWAAARTHYQAAITDKLPVTSCYAHYRLAWVSWGEGHHADAVAGLDALLAEGCDAGPTLKAAGSDLERMRRDPRVKP